MNKPCDPEKLEAAAKAADKAGDYEHAKSLREHALIERRRARERAAGLTPGWNFPLSWYR